MAKRKRASTTVSPMAGSFEDGVRTLLGTPLVQKDLGRPNAKKKAEKKSK